LGENPEFRAKDENVASPIAPRRELKDIGYELFIGALSVLSILNMFLIYAFANDADLQVVLETMNAIFMPIFLGDFLYRLRTAPSRSGYFWRGFGWADLLSSLPFPQFKILRVFRLWRVIPLMKTFGLRNLVREFVANRAANALLTVAFLVVCLLEFGALAVLSAESRSSSANITDASDALWWVYVTITTVGYGDQYPVTNAGRLVGVIVMTAGVGLFGTLTAFLANKFLAPPAQKEAPVPAPAPADANSAKARLAELQRDLEAQEQAAAALRAKVEEIQKLL
jgi:voltage-gated potassium channel